MTFDDDVRSRVERYDKFDRDVGKLVSAGSVVAAAGVFGSELARAVGFEGAEIPASAAALAVSALILALSAVKLIVSRRLLPEGCRGVSEMRWAGIVDRAHGEDGELPECMGAWLNAQWLQDRASGFLVGLVWLLIGSIPWLDKVACFSGAVSLTVVYALMGLRTVRLWHACMRALLR